MTWPKEGDGFFPESGAVIAARHESERALEDLVFGLQWLSGLRPHYDLTWGELKGCFFGTQTDANFFEFRT